MIHTGKKTHQYSQCCKAFTEASTLKRHMKTHTSDKPYQCTHCEKAFSLTSNLITHMMNHTGERPQQCSQFDKTFSNTFDLKKKTKVLILAKSHINVASGPRLYFTLPVLNDIMTHTGKKRHHCNLSENSFSEAVDLKNI